MGQKQKLLYQRADEVLMGLFDTYSAFVFSFRSRDKTPQKQQDLREWMSKKRKLRHKEWTEQLNEKRESEYKPFQSKTQREQVIFTVNLINAYQNWRKSPRGIEFILKLLSFSCN